jgi:hypothetical protein
MSASAATPQAKPKRKIVEANLSGVGPRGRWASRYAVEAYNQRGVTMVPTFGTREESMASPLRDIRRRGLAKMSWKILMGKLTNARGLGRGTLGGIADKATHGTVEEGLTSLRLVGDMLLGYMARLNSQHGIVYTAYAKGAGTIRRELDNAKQGWVQGRWQRL